MFVLTDGGNSIRFYSKSQGKGEVVTPKVEVKDTTAAGDAFVGGFLYALSAKNFTPNNLKELFHDKEELPKILSFASSCGAFAATKEGAFTSLPNQQDLNGLMLG